MKKQISPIIAFSIIILVAGIAGASIFLFNQEKEEIFVELEKELVAWEKGKRIIIPVEDFSNFEEVILYYLNKYPNNEEVLDDLFFDFYYDERKSAEENKWKDIPESRSEDFIEKLVKKTEKADIKGDEKEELIIVFTDPHKFQSFHKPGWGEFVYLSIFSYNNNKYSLEFLSESDFFRNFSFMDIDNNGKEEIIFVNYSCGMHTCSIGVKGIHFSKGNWEYIIESNSISISTADELDNFEGVIKRIIRWEDVTGDGIKELVITGGGVVATAGGGMGRPKTEIYAFNEEENKYVLTETRMQPVDHIYYLMIDANYALQEENFEEALELSLRALNNPTLFSNPSSHASSLDEKHIPRVLSYSAIQAVLAYLSQDPPNVELANNLFQRAKDKYDREDNPYISAALVLLKTYFQTEDVLEACKAMEKEIILNKDRAEFFEWHGYVTEKLELHEMCPLD